MVPFMPATHAIEASGPHDLGQVCNAISLTGMRAPYLVEGKHLVHVHSSAHGCAVSCDDLDRIMKP